MLARHNEGQAGSETAPRNHRLFSCSICTKPPVNRPSRVRRHPKQHSQSRHDAEIVRTSHDTSIRGYGPRALRRSQCQSVSLELIFRHFIAAKLMLICGGLSNTSGRYAMSESPRKRISPTLLFKRAAAASMFDGTLRRLLCVHGKGVHARCSRDLHLSPSATSAAKRHVRSAIERAANLDFSGIEMMKTHNRSYAVDACQHKLTIEQTGSIADFDACPRGRRPILDFGRLHPPRRKRSRRVGRHRLFPRHESDALGQRQRAAAMFSGATVSVPLSSSPAIRSALVDVDMTSCDMSRAEVMIVGGGRTTTHTARRRLPHHGTSCNRAFVEDHPSARRARGG